ncbi:MAG TPA: lysophospholipid acyltransferase family protein [Candidatus Dormibacteraeota bacterium]
MGATGATAASPALSRPQLLAASPALGGALYRAGARVLRAVPAGMRHAAATPGGTAWFWLSAAQRRAALDNYAAALGLDRSDPRVAHVARRAFQNYGRMLLDFLLLGDLSAVEVNARVSAAGLENIDAGLAAGRGVILALPHMGSWDMAAAFASVQGYPISAVTERFPGSLDDAVVGTRRRLGMDVIPLDRSAVRSIMQALAANRIVALVCDLEQGPGVAVRFFGRRAVVPGGPAAFAIKTGAALLPTFVYGTRDGRYHGEVHQPLAWSPSDSKESLTQRIIDRFEEFIKERPDQWYAFRPMFS